jgi:hypothetical protein
MKIVKNNFIATAPYSPTVDNEDSPENAVSKISTAINYFVKI